MTENKNPKIYKYYWGNNPVRAGFRGRLCVLLAVGGFNSALVEFIDTGERLLTDRRAIRRINYTLIKSLDFCGFTKVIRGGDLFKVSYIHLS